MKKLLFLFAAIVAFSCSELNAQETQKATQDSTLKNKPIVYTVDLGDISTMPRKAIKQKIDGIIGTMLNSIPGQECTVKVQALTVTKGETLKTETSLTGLNTELAKSADELTGKLLTRIRTGQSKKI